MGGCAARRMGPEDLEFVHVNELHGGAATAAHLLTFDSVHGTWPHDVAAADDGLAVDGTSSPSPRRPSRRGPGATSASMSF